MLQFRLWSCSRAAAGPSWGRRCQAHHSRLKEEKKGQRRRRAEQSGLGIQIRSLGTVLCENGAQKTEYEEECKRWHLINRDRRGKALWYRFCSRFPRPSHAGAASALHSPDSRGTAYASATYAFKQQIIIIFEFRFGWLHLCQPCQTAHHLLGSAGPAPCS